MTAKSLSIEGGALAIPEPDDGGVRAYKGIPYAAPPVARLRWRPPQPVPPWTGVRPVAAFGPNSLQGVVFDDIDPRPAGVSEDCLYLNVWTPAAPDDGARLPTMVWIHGGGFVVGSGAEPRYDGAHLAARGILVVTAQPSAQCAGLSRPSGAHRQNWSIALPAITACSISSPRSDGSSATSRPSAAIPARSRSPANPPARRRRARSWPRRSPRGSSRASSARAARCSLRPPARRRRSRQPRSPASTSCARSERKRWPSCAPPRPRPFSPPRRGSATVRSSTDGFSRARRPRSSPPASRATRRSWPAGTRMRASISRCCRTRTGARSLIWSRTRFGDRAEEALRLYPGGSPERDMASARALGGDLTIIHATWAWIEAQKQNGGADIFRFRFDRAPLTPKGWFGERASRDAGAFHAVRNLVRTRQSARLSVDYRRRRPRAGEARVELLGQLRQDRRPQWPRLAALAIVSQRRRAGDDAGHAGQRRAGGRAGATRFPAGGRESARDRAPELALASSRWEGRRRPKQAPLPEGEQASHHCRLEVHRAAAHREHVGSLYTPCPVLPKRRDSTQVGNHRAFS